MCRSLIENYKGFEKFYFQVNQCMCSHLHNGGRKDVYNTPDIMAMTMENTL